ncbi:uncharacterized protein LOC141526401 [Cotesia typhae]|uniref:uncharacterized protein LOC141526401 n=1 Tax=Cotesia typhae TaxID=2053667 RepID=UPI003D689D95
MQTQHNYRAYTAHSTFTCTREYGIDIEHSQLSTVVSFTRSVLLTRIIKVRDTSLWAQEKLSYRMLFVSPRRENHGLLSSLHFFIYPLGFSQNNARNILTLFSLNLRPEEFDEINLDDDDDDDD